MKGQIPGRTIKPLVKLGKSPNDCWEWLGNKNPNTGYGKKRFNGKDVLAHRWIYEQLFGIIPDGMVINHICNNRSCVNPHHLEVVTQTENCRKGNGTKLNIEQVKYIKSLKGKLPRGGKQQLACELEITQSLISDIWYGRCWIDV